jgi:HlyD family secretion protein
VGPKASTGWKWWLIPTLLVAGVIAGGAWWVTRGVAHAANNREGDGGEAHAASSAVQVEVARPRKGGLERTLTGQPGTVQAYESVQVYAEVSGYLKAQNVDYGSHVKGPEYDASGNLTRPGDILAVIDVPDLKEQVDRCQAEVKHAKARVKLMEAKVISAKAELTAARAAVDQAKASRKSAWAAREFRSKQFIRYRELVGKGSVDERLVDEKEELLQAATEAENAAIAAVNTANAQVAAAEAKVEQAKADVDDARAQQGVAEADLRKAEVMKKFATIRAEFDGVVTHREFFRGDFIRTATGGQGKPLYTLERLDKVRVVVQVTDDYVPYTNVGDEAIVEIDALPGQKFHAKVSRTAESEDPHTRLMHTEIDVVNPKDKKGMYVLKQGMYGKVTIVLEKGNPDSLTIPSSCLANLPDSDAYGVYVVRDGKAHLVPVTLGIETGVQVEVLKGLKPDDQVVINHGAVTEGLPVVVTAAPAGSNLALAH